MKSFVANLLHHPSVLVCWLVYVWLAFVQLTNYDKSAISFNWHRVGKFLIFVVVAYLIIDRKRIITRIKAVPITVLLLTVAWIFLIVCSLFFNDFSKHPIRRALILAVSPLVVFSLVGLLKSTQLKLHLLLFSAIGGVFIATLVNFVAWLGWYESYQLFIGDPFIYTNIRHLNMDQFIAICLCVMLYTTSGVRGVHKNALVVVGVGLFLFMVWAEARASLLALVVFFFVYYRRIIFNMVEGKKRWVGVLVLCTAAVLIWQAWPLPTMQDISSKQVFNVADVFSSKRLTYWVSAIEFAQDSPIIGLGPEAFKDNRYEIYGGYWMVQLHNVFVQTYFELGLLGVLLVIGFFVYLFVFLRKALTKCQSNCELLNGVFACLLGVGVNAMFDGVFFHGYTLTLVLVVISVGVYIGGQSDKTTGI